MPEKMQECLRFVAYSIHVCNWIAMRPCWLCCSITPTSFLTARLMPQSHESRGLALTLQRAFMKCILEIV